MRKVKGFLIPVVGKVCFAWGGDTQDLNHHHKSKDQRFAFDIAAIGKNRKFYRSDWKQNKDHYFFGREVICPFRGKVVEAIDGVHESVPGKPNKYSAVGNSVVIRHDATTYSILAHLKQDSVAVKRGQVVEAGEIIGLCGNSGHSTGPHLHFHVQSTAILGKGQGIKCYFLHVMKGKERLLDYSPVKGDILKNTGTTMTRNLLTTRRRVVKG